MHKFLVFSYFCHIAILSNLNQLWQNSKTEWYNALQALSNTNTAYYHNSQTLVLINKTCFILQNNSTDTSEICCGHNKVLLKKLNEKSAQKLLRKEVSQLMRYG